MTAPQCYHCGRYAPSHREMCPGHPQWRKLAPIMTQAEFDRLIPVGEWAYSDEGLGEGARFRRNTGRDAS